MGTRNFGLGSRSILDAGRMALQRDMASFDSIVNMTSRWRSFCVWLREHHDIGRMEHITRDMLVEYGVELAEQIALTQLAVPTAHNRLSAVNRVLEISRGDRNVWASAVRDCGIPRRSYAAAESKAISEEKHAQAVASVSLRVRVLLNIQRCFGLRFRESALLNAKRALLEALSKEQITVVAGTKGGRSRKVPITSLRQTEALVNCAEIQGTHHSMVPSEESYATFRARAYREIAHTPIHFHGQRFWYAEARYEALVGAPAPTAAGVPHGQPHLFFLSERLGEPLEVVREKDRKARQKIAQELGHNRVEVTRAYCG